MRIATAGLLGAQDEARRRFDAAWERWGRIAPQVFLPVLVVTDHERELRDLMKQWMADPGHASPSLWFQAYNALGEMDKAIDWLNRAIDQGSAPAFVRVQGLYPKLHQHPRFREMLPKLEAMDKRHKLWAAL